MINVTLYTREDCHLCEQVVADLESLQEKIPHRLVLVDVDSDPALYDKYGQVIPVVEVGPYRLTAPFSRQDLMMTLGAASDRRTHLEHIDDKAYQERVQRGRTITGTDRFSDWISRHYLAVINFFLLLYVGLPFLAPALMKVGATAPANVIYRVYSPLCHQLGFRSWFLFGEQPVYPRVAAGVEGYETFGRATGIDEEDLWAARAFTGNEILGYKTALCQRDVALYGAMLLFGLIFALTGRRIRPLHWALWILIGIGPIGLDGFSQLISQMRIPALLSILPYRESTPFLRTLTGFLFGFSTAWFGFPYVEESMRETRQFLIKKFAVVNAAE
ncbi:MAG: DUF2085 domain-containing protein [Chloroflexi bacterium]|nr:DUF2085 domain-containing protein [Chloroflexota bacterium]